MADEKIANRTAVALGNFDGMHVGHMAVLRAAKGFESKGLTPLALLFDEHSLKAITGTAPPMLMTADERNRIIAENGLKIKTIVFNEIKDLSPQDIRKFIESGEIEKANKMLGHPFGFCTRVIDGDKRGRTLGFPTINQELPDGLVLPKFGVYQADVTVDGEHYKGVANIGMRPTVGTEKILSETYIIDFDESIYGESVDIRLIKFIRPERKFSSFDELARQIKTDAKECADV